MPCSDITEALDVRIDFDDRLCGYALNKRSCGRPVGGETLLPMVLGRTVDELLETTIDELVPELDAYGEIDQFLLMKQFGAICAALSVYRGDDAGSLGQHFVLHQLEHDLAETRLVGDVAIEAVVAEIKACKGCGTKKPKRRRQLPTL